jgi:hypothetical protein
MRNANTVDMNAEQLGETWGVTPRMVNIYKAKAEKRVGRKLGIRRGKAYYFSSEEQQLLWEIKEQGVDVQQVAQEHQASAAANFDTANAQCETSMLTNMSAIAERNDQQAIALGQQLGQRFVNVTYASMMQTMALGMAQIGNELGEMQASLTVSLPSLDSQMIIGQEESLMLEAVE